MSALFGGEFYKIQWMYFLLNQDTRFFQLFPPLKFLVEGAMAFAVHMGYILRKLCDYGNA
jgi:hypothetical protein